MAGHYVWLDWLGIFFASYCQYLVGGALLLFLLAAKTKKEETQRATILCLSFLAALVARYGITSPLHHLFMRPRPFVVYQVNQLIVYAVDKSSFPSGHAAFFFGLAMVVYFYNKKAGWWFLSAALLISLARVFVGVHYPLDILVGALIGLLSGWVVWWGGGKIKLLN